ncbi:MAG: hypothetical protein VB050_11080 [Geobacteraceae bacterium]|nr:hypothetical protein [Geobacteraceae bacterium]
MAWEYRQHNGALYFNGNHIATGYSGRGAGRNNPTCRIEADLSMQARFQGGDIASAHHAKAGEPAPILWTSPR